MEERNDLTFKLHSTFTDGITLPDAFNGFVLLANLGQVLGLGKESIAEFALALILLDILDLLVLEYRFII